MTEAKELCEEAVKVCYEFINKRCSGCYLKSLCQDWNKNYSDIDNRNIITDKINATFIEQVKPKITVTKSKVSDSIKKIANKPIASNELF